ncbi:hypothetical protein [Streptomyces sp. NPDC054771]
MDHQTSINGAVVGPSGYSPEPEMGEGSVSVESNAQDLLIGLGLAREGRTFPMIL